MTGFPPNCFKNKKELTRVSCFYEFHAAVVDNYNGYGNQCLGRFGWAKIVWHQDIYIYIYAHSIRHQIKTTFFLKKKKKNCTKISILQAANHGKGFGNACPMDFEWQ